MLRSRELTSMPTSATLVETIRARTGDACEGADEGAGVEAWPWGRWVALVSAEFEGESESTRSGGKGIGADGGVDYEKKCAFFRVVVKQWRY